MNWIHIRRELKSISLYSLAGAIIGGIISSIQAQELSLQQFSSGFVDGLIIAILLVLDVFAATRWFRSYFRKIPTLIHFIVHPPLQLFLILFGRALGGMIMSGAEFSLVGTDSYFISSIVASISVLLLVQFMYQISLLTGHKTLFKFMMGRYTKPREENLFVMFVDLKASTKIAEQMGNVRFMEFLDRVFFDLGRSVIETKGEIYKYVGDEAIIIWPKRTAEKNLLSISFFFNLEKRIQNNAAYYQKNYQTIPRFRAGLHYGLTVVGEVGDVKREIAYMGDTINTSARIADLCKSEDQNLLISRAVCAHLPTETPYQFSSLGDVALKGKTIQHELLSVTCR